MSDKQPETPLAVTAADVPVRTKQSTYPEPFFSRMAKRHKQVLGDLFGLRNFGVNRTRLAPGGESALLHRHVRQDEFVYILEGEAVLVTDHGEVALRAGMCAGFPVGGVAHQIVNRSDRDVVFLEIGDRTPGEDPEYPRDDLKWTRQADGTTRWTHKDGRPY